MVDMLCFENVTSCFSLRTGVRTVRERAPFPSITLGRSDSDAWGFLSCSTRTTWTSRLPAAPSPLEASPAWATIGGLWIVGGGRPPSWVGTSAAYNEDRLHVISLQSCFLSSELPFGESEDSVWMWLSASKLGQFIINICILY